MNFYPNFLQTEEIELALKPTRKQFVLWHENENKRFQEAFEYPIEKLNMDIYCYEFDYILEMEEKITFSIIIDKITEQYILNLKADSEFSDWQQTIIHNIDCDIDLFRGVTQEDIDKRSPRFIGYAASLMEIFSK